MTHHKHKLKAAVRKLTSLAYVV